MAPMFLMLLALAAVLEVGGDAAVRRGLLQSSWGWMLAGSLALVAYGFTVNVSRSIDFGRLMGLYIAVFFAVSQLVNLLAFGGRPSASLLLGGALIVCGGLIIQAGMR
jgi:drug/metabolite transporter superfamily protein YnfA